MKKLLKTYKSNTRVYDDDSIEVTPQQQGEPTQKDVKKVGRSKRYATTSKNPLMCIELKCPDEVVDKAKNLLQKVSDAIYSHVINGNIKPDLDDNCINVKSNTDFIDKEIKELKNNLEIYKNKEKKNEEGKENYSEKIKKLLGKDVKNITIYQIVIIFLICLTVA